MMRNNTADEVSDVWMIDTLSLYIQLCILISVFCTSEINVPTPLNIRNQYTEQNLF